MPHSDPDINMGNDNATLREAKLAIPPGSIGEYSGLTIKRKNIRDSEPESETDDDMPKDQIEGIFDDQTDEEVLPSIETVENDEQPSIAFFYGELQMSSHINSSPDAQPSKGKRAKEGEGLQPTTPASNNVSNPYSTPNTTTTTSEGENGISEEAECEHVEEAHTEGDKSMQLDTNTSNTKIIADNDSGISISCLNTSEPPRTRLVIRNPDPVSESPSLSDYQTPSTSPFSPSPYFKLTDLEICALVSIFGDLDNFGVELFSQMIHVLAWGVRVADQKDIPGINDQDPTGKELLQYIEFITSSHEKQDECLPLRMTCPSIKYMKTELPEIGEPLSMFQFLLWQVFAYGSSEKLNDLNIERFKSRAGAAGKNFWTKLNRGESGEVKVMMDILIELIGADYKHEAETAPSKVKGAHGCKFWKKYIPSMLKGLWELSFELIPGTSAGQMERFEDVWSLIVNKRIPTLKKDEDITWSILADLVEYRFCERPTMMDLTEHIRSSSNGKKSEAAQALERVAQLCNCTPPEDVDSLVPLLQSMLTMLNRLGNPTVNYDVDAEDQLTSVRKLARRCKSIQRRNLGPLDLERVLCQITKEAAWKEPKEVFWGDATTDEQENRGEEEDKGEGEGEEGVSCPEPISQRESVGGKTLPGAVENPGTRWNDRSDKDANMTEANGAALTPGLPAEDPFTDSELTETVRLMAHLQSAQVTVQNLNASTENPGVNELNQVANAAKKLVEELKEVQLMAKNIRKRSREALHAAVDREYGDSDGSEKRQRVENVYRY